MIYKYYKELYSEEHMLYSKEIASIYNLIDEKGNPRYRVVTNAISKYLKDNDIDYEPFYYETKYGLCQVFPKRLYEPAMANYFENKGGQ